MAVTADGARLTETHRRAQVALRGYTARQLATVWPAFNIDDIAGTWPAVEAAMVQIVRTNQPTSSRIAGRYYRDFRAAEGAAGIAEIILAEVPSVEQIAPNLRYVGARAAGIGVALNRSDVASTAFTNVEGEMARQVLNGGRSTIEATVKADRDALGWQRVTDGNPCAFCAMLASRGPVYKAETSTFQAHSHCACTAEPVYSTETALPGRSEEFRDLWNSSTRGYSGRDALNAFRRALNA